VAAPASRRDPGAPRLCIRLRLLLRHRRPGCPPQRRGDRVHPPIHHPTPRQQGQGRGDIGRWAGGRGELGSLPPGGAERAARGRVAGRRARSADAREGRRPEPVHLRRRRGGGRTRCPIDDGGGCGLRGKAAAGWGLGRMGVGLGFWSIYMQDSWADQVRGLGRPVFGWASFVFQWATIVFKWVAFSCRVRASTACRDRGPNTAHHRVVPALTLRPSCRARVRVVFFSVVRRATRRVWPIWTSICTSADPHLFPRQSAIHRRSTTPPERPFLHQKQAANPLQPKPP
jgi:hypothetical protein